LRAGSGEPGEPKESEKKKRGSNLGGVEGGAVGTGLHYQKECPNEVWSMGTLWSGKKRENSRIKTPTGRVQGAKKGSGQVLITEIKGTTTTQREGGGRLLGRLSPKKWAGPLKGPKG